MPVDLFNIQCTTCRASLVVRDESVIGDILACPKCGSMVHVEPPADWSSAGETAVANAEESPEARSPSAKRVSRTKVAAIPPALPKRGEASPTAQPAAPAATAATERHGSDSSVTGTPVGDTPASLRAAALPAAEMAMPAGSRSAAWMRLPLVASGIGSGVALGTLAWLVVWLQSPGQVQIAVGEPAVVAPTAADEIAADPPARPTQPSAEAPAELSTGTPEPSFAAEEPPLEVASEESVQQPATALEQPAEVVAGTPAPSRVSTPALKLEPVESSDAPIASGDGAQAEPTPSAAEKQAGEDGLSDVGEADDTLVDHGSPGNEAPLAAEQITARLGMSLARVDFSGVPLAQFAMFVSDVAGVPVILDDAALAQVGKSRKTTVDVRLVDTTALEALRAASRSAGVAFAIEDGKVRITAQAR